MPFFGPLDEEHNPEEIELPSNFKDNLEENEPLRYRIIREYCRDKYGKDEKDIKALIGRYWGLVTQVDLSVGAILKTLDDLGLAENTIVVYTSDHGDMMGSHHMVEKSVMYEEAVRIPWLMRIPQMKGRLIKNRVSQIDMIPTLLDLMNCDEDCRFPGQSLVPLIKGNRVEQDHVFIEWNPNSGAMKVKKGGTQLALKGELRRLENEHTRTVISPDGWKLCLSDSDKCQLFNINKDPGETVNLFGSSRHDDIIRKLSTRIHKWQETVDDKVKV